MRAGGRRARRDRPLLSFGYFVSLPVQQVLDLEQLLDRAAFGFQLLGNARLFDPHLTCAGDLRQVIEIPGQVGKKRQ